jgi:hypothetical protein
MIIDTAHRHHSSSRQAAAAAVKAATAPRGDTREIRGKAEGVKRALYVTTSDGS